MSRLPLSGQTLDSAERIDMVVQMDDIHSFGDEQNEIPRP